jgi:peptidyl-prolyl cis-trans isomerase SurA
MKMTPLFRSAMLPLAALAALFVATPAGVAQQASLPGFDGAAPSASFLQKAAAIVNGDVVTELDVEQRLALVVVASGGNIPQEERQRLRAQILRNLIDEMLQVQEGKEHDIVIDDGQVTEAYDRVAQNFKQKPQQFTEFLSRVGSSRDTLMSQIRSELAWSRVLRRRVEPFVNVGDDEVQAIIDRLEAAKGQEEYRLFEIYVPATADVEGEVRESLSRIRDQIRNGASFIAYARQFSQAATAALGGDVGWVRTEQLADDLRVIVPTLSPGVVSDPIRVPGGFYLLLVPDKRTVLGKDPLAAELTMKQVAVPAPGANMAQGERQAFVDRIATAARGTMGCGKAEDAAKALGGQVSDVGPVAIREFPQGLHAELQELKIGQATQPILTPRDARFLVLCGRDEPQQQGPDFDQVYAQLNDQRVGMMSRRYMRDLRRDAVVDYR